jgi:hypothetical protein
MKISVFNHGGAFPLSRFPNYSRSSNRIRTKCPGNCPDFKGTLIRPSKSGQHVSKNVPILELSGSNRIDRDKMSSKMSRFQPGVRKRRRMSRHEPCLGWRYRGASLADHAAAAAMPPELAGRSPAMSPASCDVDMSLLESVSAEPEADLIEQSTHP